MNKEDELLIVLDLIKTYSEAAQLNDAISKIDNVKAELLRASQIQVKSTVQNELVEPLKEFNQNADKFWAQGAHLINELHRQSVGGQNSWELGGVEMEFLRII